MGEVIVVTSGKGGVGKTTTTANLGMGLALLGKKVCIVDADIGLRNLDVVLGLENRIVYDIVALVEGRCKIRQALIKDKRNENLYLLPAAQSTDKNAINEDQMKKLCNDLKKDFDYVLIDCPAGIEQGFKNAISGADRALIVVTPEVSAVRDADRIVGLLEAAELTDHKLIINRIRAGMVERKDMLNTDDILEVLAIGLIGVVPDDESIIVSTNIGAPVVLTNGSKSATAYMNISKRITGEDVPFMDISKSDGFFSKLKSLFSSK